MPEAGEQLGRFEIVREIGRGGMAVVFLARQIDLNREVALKQLAAFHATDPAAAARFLQESRITGSLGHPNIVTVHEYLQHDQVPYIAMEYLERGSLRPFVRGLGLAQVAGILEGVLAALAHAADQGIVHRDLKPENLMLTRQGTVKVADFGIAKAVNLVSTSYATATGTTVGTPAYMAPEQAMAKGVGPATDLYAVGVMAYEMLVGKVPFTADTPVAVLLQHVNEPLPSPLEVKPDLDEELARWLEWMLQKRPEDRPASAGEAWDALEGIVIRLAGPRWRREARLLGTAASAVAPPLTPAPFQSIQSPATPAPENREPAPAATFPPPAPAPTGFETFARGADPQAPAAPASEPQAAPPARPDDGFRTFEPSSRPASPPPAPPPLPAPPAPAGEPVAAAVVTPPPMEAAQAPAEAPSTPTPAPEQAAAAVTTPPQQRTPPPSEAPPAAPGAAPGDGAPPAGGRRRLGLIGGAAAAVAVVVIVAVVVLGGGGEKEGSTPPEEPAGTSAVPDLVLQDRPDLAAAGASLLVADQSGRVLKVDGGRVAASLDDPAGPRAVAADGTRVYVADDQAVTVLRARDLRPVAATAFEGAVAMASAAGQPVAVAGATRADRGRVCLVSAAGALTPCLALDFAPTGLGVGASALFVADGETGRILPVQNLGDSLTAGQPVAVGPGAHGRMVVDRGRLYVPIERGVASVDVATGQPLGTFATETTPADLFVAPSSGLLFAPLPGSDRVAVFDTSRPDAPPTMVEAGARPAAVAGTADGGVVVLASGDGTLVRLDPATGAAGRTTDIEGFAGSAPAPVVLQSVESSREGRTVTLRLELEGGRLPPGSLVVGDRGIGDGRAALVVWQGGIRSSVTAVRPEGVRVAVAPRAGRLVVALSAGRGAFTSMTARLEPDGAAVVIALTEPAPEPTPPSPGPSPGPTPSPTPSPTPTPTPTPTPEPEPPKFIPG